MTDRRGCDLRNTFLDPNCEGVCQTDFIFNSKGEAVCEKDLEFSPIGCTNYTVATKQDCLAIGSKWRWYKLSLNKTNCENTLKVCYDNAGASTSYKNQTECLECNGEYKSPFTWKESYWVLGEDFYNTQWLSNSGWGQLNQWNHSINTNIIEKDVRNIMVTKFAPAAQSDLLCNVMPYVYSFKSLACDCSGDPNTPVNCYNNGTQSYLIGTAKVCNGWQEILVSGPLQLTVYKNSVPVNLGCIGIQASILPSPQFYRQEILSTDVLSNSIQRYMPYDIVVNNHSVIVGQLIGDGIQLDFTYNVGGGLGGELSEYSGQLESPAQICIDARSDIDKHFPVYDLAALKGGKWVPLNANVIVSFNDVSAGRICANVSYGLAYFPILRIDGWEDAVPKPLFTKVQEAFIYLIGIVFILTACYCAYSLFVQVWAGHRKTGTVKITLPRLLNALLFLFCMVRGLYLVLTPSESISAEKNLGGFYFLSEFPIYVFLSLFSSLVFYWADLMHNAKHGKFLERMRWPFIIVNTLMYIMFVVVISVYRRLDADEQYDMKIVYSTILSALCAIFIIGFWLYGGKLIIIQIQVLRIKNQSLNRNLRNT
ncbi:hypothetical protein DFA_02610 [Cavenderia fasciculata]|uniref:THH1/TOM1/TOM3 domain-containing protein n=1 Tax=Cavenderia fasciculata TaxID=261658 RepID=F4PZV7_CACFS|nr:uncharacterized protein DFA_02610 [Cavenderia fasciculata]EGG18871.1 hypothetical protein DFA_02610 [Cavenderia fasciculata]|eukprot:XP_004357333.1 hypothetical protein DFA_02610 [Cavenderia fasciculata]